MRIEIFWVPQKEERVDDTVNVSAAVGFGPEQLGDDLAGFSSETILPAEGSIGKGASGSGIGLAFELAERALNDFASLLEVGYAIRSAIRAISTRRGRPPAGANGAALGALAAASEPRLAQDVEGWRYVRTVPITTDGGVGTDMRDVWISSFVHEGDGQVQLVFQSSTTRYLGSATVGVEWWFDGTDGAARTDDELKDRLSAWFAGPSE